MTEHAMTADRGGGGRPREITGRTVLFALLAFFGVVVGVNVVMARFAVTTFAGFAAPYIAADDSLPVVAAIDARHDHLYIHVFGPGGRTLVAPRLVGLADALRIATSGSPRVVGTGARLLASHWPSAAAIPAAIDPRRAPDIGWVARLGAAAQDTGTPPKPLYLRAPDAKPQGAAQLARR